MPGNKGLHATELLVAGLPATELICQETKAPDILVFAAAFARSSSYTQPSKLTLQTKLAD